MGIHHFFSWFRKMFGNDTITNIKKTDSLNDKGVDNLLLDLNGVIHTSCQKIYRYGNHKHKSLLLQSKFNKKRYGLKDQINVYKDVCKTIDEIVQIVRPKKRIVICIDGVAPQSKQRQQRGRRFKSVIERSDIQFDSNSITPGTKFLHNLSNYIDWYIISQLQNGSPLYKNKEIIFSNEKVPGEGEAKCFAWVRLYGNINETYCIHSLDSDIIMLCLSCSHQNFYILRESLYDKAWDYQVVDMKSVRVQLKSLLHDKCVNDFVLICYLVGNDFLPKIPSIDIVKGGINTMMSIYKSVFQKNGNIFNENGRQYNLESLRLFFEKLGELEHNNLQDKANSSGYFKDTLLESCCTVSEESGKKVLDFEKYKELYYKTKFKKGTSVESICHSYIQGMLWVHSYYYNGVTNWSWKFKHNYGPFCQDIATCLKTFSHNILPNDSPLLPFQQLLSVLPPQSSNLLPDPLNTILVDKKSQFAKYVPDKVDIDIEGHKYRWTGIVQLPFIDFDVLCTEYNKYIENVSPKDKKRNKLMNPHTYTKNNSDHFDYLYRSFYGNIKNCRVTKHTLVV